MSTSPAPFLSPLGRRWRALHLVVLPGVLFALANFRPGSLPAWFPFATSCGAITGLPCIFCGTTRAIYHLLHGELARALYYNWLSFPLLGGALALYILNLIELCTSRDFLSRVPRPRLTGRSAAVFACGFVLLWCLQVYLAVSQHKSELLNPHGPLYSFVVR
jgi:hypothetical protein